MIFVQVGENAPLPTTFEIFRLTANSSIRKETVCSVCEKDTTSAPQLGELVNCTGNCQSSFHSVCASVVQKDTFKCSACIAG